LKAPQTESVGGRIRDEEMKDDKMKDDKMKDDRMGQSLDQAGRRGGMNDPSL